MKIKNKLYGGKVILDFNKFKHTYTVKGEKIPSVTTVLGVINKPALVAWAARMATDHVIECIDPGVSYDELQLNAIFEGAKKAHWQKKTDAGNIGTLVHEWVEDYINDKNPKMPVNEQLNDAVSNFMDWVHEHDVKFLKAEEPAFSKKYKYAGIIDFICTIDGKLYIGDLKTSKGIYPEYLLQTSAYRYARAEEYPDEDYKGTVIVRVGKDGSFETGGLDDEETYSMADGREVSGLALYQEMVVAFLSAQRLRGTMEALKKFAQIGE